MRRIRLGPGGKVLMVLAGLALIVWGLVSYGALEWAGIPAPGERRASGPAASRAPQRSTEGPARGTSLGAPPAAARAPASLPPPLFVAPPRAPVVSFDSDPDARLRAVRSGGADLASFGLLELARRTTQTQGLVVVGASPAQSGSYLCAAGSPLEAFRAGATVRAGGEDARLVVAHVAEVVGVPATRLRFVEAGAADLFVTDMPVTGASCIAFAQSGAAPPRVVLAREDDALRYGAGYRGALEKIGATSPAAVGFLRAPASQPGGYAAQAAYYADLSVRLLGTPRGPMPKVAEWVLAEPPEGTP